MFEITNIAAGALIGAGLAWIISLWVKVFVAQVLATSQEDSTNISSDSYSVYKPDWGVFAAMSIAGGALAGWRQWSPELLSDLILVATLVGIALIDIKTLLIEGRLITLAIILRLSWLLYFAPEEILNSLAGLLIGAGLLFFVGFLYETFRHRQGLGEGDAAVLGLIGMWVGWQGLGAVLLIAAVTGIIIGGISLVKKREANQELKSLLQTQIPFAPFLCLAGIIVYLHQEIGFQNFGFGFDYF